RILAAARPERHDDIDVDQVGETLQFLDGQRLGATFEIAHAGALDTHGGAGLRLSLVGAFTQISQDGAEAVVAVALERGILNGVDFDLHGVHWKVERERRRFRPPGVHRIGKWPRLAPGLGGRRWSREPVRTSGSVRWPPRP